MSESETSLPPEAAKEQQFFGTKWTLDNSIEETKNNSLPLLQHLPSSSNFDSSFRYIDRRIVNEVAKQIGNNGPELCRNLGVLDKTIAEAREEHPGKLTEQNYFMLTCWCRSAGRKGTIEALKKGLRECQRNDVVALIDDLQKELLACEGFQENVC
ncbi:hypothetical protein C0Q70_03006 [Pomacea canaliculata]|uniref:Death domain-containing protein n=1 Tax=Pomacea canaliculata TaxID=400727 RepID=A0A2T7PRI3_POMCA|nr:hypothetical protein C0Q70_03006 [Pomacea canaliculata]